MELHGKDNQIIKVAFIWSLCSAALLWLHSQLYSEFISDQALVSIRYAERLLAGEGLTWNNGQAVEGYTNLLWILLTAATGSFGVDLIIAVRGLGLFFNISVIFALFSLFIYFFKKSRLVPQNILHSVLPLVTGQLFWVFSGSTAVWTMGGLEQPLFTASLVWAFTFLIPALQQEKPSKRLLLLTSICLMITVLTRADGIIFIVPYCCIWVWQKRKQSSDVSKVFYIGVLPAIAFLMQIIFRLEYYGKWLPDTAYIPALSTTGIITGLKYIVDTLTAARPFFEITLLGIAFAIYKKRNQFILSAVLIPAVIWSIYVAITGGDNAPAFRLGLPVYGIISLALLIITVNANAILNRTTPMWLQWCLIAFCFLPFLASQLQDPENKEAFYEKWELDGQAVGETLGTAFKSVQPLYAMATPGALSYWSKLPSLDLSGINTRNDTAFILEQKPDIISFCSPAGSLTPCRNTSQELIKLPEFHQQYLPLYIHIKPENGRPEFINIQWVRWNDGKTGIYEDENTIEIPAYLGAISKETAAQLEADTLSIKLASTDQFGLPVNINTAQIISQATTIRVLTSEGELTVPGPELQISKLTNNRLVIQNTSQKELIIHKLIVVKPARQVAIR